MSKKCRRKQLSEKVLRSKRRETKTEKKPNPFELKFNKQKHEVAGQRKRLTGAVGLPLQSRQRAFEQRKRTLLVEYKRFGKANELVDRRLGERNPNLTPDQKMALRFAAERVRRYRGGGIHSEDDHAPSSSNFQLTGAESILTHKGTALSEIEKLNDRPLLDDEDEEGGQILGSDFIKLAHFGGGHEGRKEGEDGVTEESGEKKKSRKELIEEMIENSKRTRYEMQMQRDKISDLTADLDAQWKEALRENVVSQWIRTDKDDDTVKSKQKESSGKETVASVVQKDPTKKETTKKEDTLDYDRLVHEMTFEPKAAAGADKPKKKDGDADMGDEETEDSGESKKSKQKSKMARSHVTGDDDISDLQLLKQEVKKKTTIVKYDSEGRRIRDESSDGEEEAPPSKKQRKSCGIEFLEPRIEANFNPERKKRKTAKGEIGERQKLTQKYKKELRGTIRELKRDNEFLARQQLLEQRQEDAERRNKVKALMKSLVSQETECRKMKKKKK